MTFFSFRQLLKAAREGMEIEQRAMAKAIGCSPQYLSDMESGRRMPSVRITNAICKWLGRGPEGRRQWHLAAARAHGWEV